jgi:hypothetical protein
VKRAISIILQMLEFDMPILNVSVTLTAEVSRQGKENLETLPESQFNRVWFLFPLFCCLFFSLICIFFIDLVITIVLDKGG